jgi:arylsulfatase A-like enzyme
MKYFGYNNGLVDNSTGIEMMCCDNIYAASACEGKNTFTPNLNALAKDGKIFTNYHTAATCLPARVSLLSSTVRFPVWFR